MGDMEKMENMVRQNEAKWGESYKGENGENVRHEKMDNMANWGKMGTRR